MNAAEDVELNKELLQAIGKEAESAPQPESDKKFAFVINTPDPFWSYARAAALALAASLLASRFHKSKGALAGT